MFQSKQDVLFIEKGIITLFRVSVGKKSIAQKIIALDWTPETIVTVLQKLRKASKQHIRVLLSDEFVYILNIQLPLSQQIQQDMVRQAAQEFIPENLSETVWSYKEVQRVPKKDELPHKHIHIVAYTHLAATIIYSAFSKTSFRIDRIESVSESLNNLIKNPTKTILLIYIQQKSMLVVSERGVLVTSVLVSDVLDKTFIENYIDTLQKSHVTQLDNVIFSGAQPSFPLEKDIKTIPVTAHMLDPIAGLALQKDINKKIDVEPFMVYPQSATPSSNTNQKRENDQLGETDSKDKPNSQKNTLITIVCIVILLITLVGWYLFQEQTKVKETTNETTSTTPTQIVTPTPIESSEKTASPSAELLSSYSITILNGSGRIGEATTLSDSLTQNGYSIVSVGNAEDVLEHTEVRYKESVEERVKLTLDKELKNLYSFNRGSIIEEDNESDIIIIVGIE